MKFCFINRVLYAVLLLLSVAAMLAQVMPHDVLDLAEVQPLELPAVNIPDLIDPGEINEPSRNVFDKDGHVWQRPRETRVTLDVNGKPIATVSTTTVLGLVRLRGVDGVLTLEGFVPIGKSINGGKLVDAGQGEYILEFDGQRQVFAIDDNNQERRRKHFQSLGLPFLN